MNDETSSEFAQGQQRLARDMRKMVEDAEALLRSAASSAGEATAEARSKLVDSLQSAKARLGELEQTVRERGAAAGRATDNYVREHPWQAIGVAAAVGALVALLVSRRDD